MTALYRMTRRNPSAFVEPFRFNVDRILHTIHSLDRNDRGPKTATHLRALISARDRNSVASSETWMNAAAAADINWVVDWTRPTNYNGGSARRNQWWVVMLRYRKYLYAVSISIGRIVSADSLSIFPCIVRPSFCFCFCFWGSILYS